MRKLIAIITGQYVPFKPVYAHGDQLVVSQNPVSAEMLENIKLVFGFYGVAYREAEDGIILIPKYIWEDKDTMWNYTTKANDASWLNTHKTRG